MKRKDLIKGFAERLARCRADRGWSLQVAANLIGISKTHLWTTERRDQAISVATAVRMAEVYGVTLDWLLRGVSRDA